MKKSGAIPRVYARYTEAVRSIVDYAAGRAETVRRLESTLILGLFAHFEGALVRDFGARRLLMDRVASEDPRVRGVRQLVAAFDKAQSLRDRRGTGRESIELRLDAYESTYADAFAAREIRKGVRRVLEYRNWAAHGRSEPSRPFAFRFDEAARAIENWFVCIPHFPLHTYDLEG